MVSVEELKRNNSEKVTVQVCAVVVTVLATDTSPRPIVFKASCQTDVVELKGIEIEFEPLPDEVATLTDLIVKSPDGGGTAALTAYPATTVDTET